MGQTLFTGVFNGQGVIQGTLTLFENFTFEVPSDFPAGKASFQAWNVVLSTPPVSVGFVCIMRSMADVGKDHAYPGNEYANVSVEVAA